MTAKFKMCKYSKILGRKSLKYRIDICDKILPTLFKKLEIFFRIQLYLYWSLSCLKSNTRNRSFTSNRWSERKIRHCQKRVIRMLILLTVSVIWTLIGGSVNICDVKVTRKIDYLNVPEVVYWNKCKFLKKAKDKWTTSFSYI